MKLPWPLQLIVLVCMYGCAILLVLTDILAIMPPRMDIVSTIMAFLGTALAWFTAFLMTYEFGKERLGGINR